MFSSHAGDSSNCQWAKVINVINLSSIILQVIGGHPGLIHLGAKVIILQGIFGTIPSAAQSFTTMYLQRGLMGFRSKERMVPRAAWYRGDDDDGYQWLLYI